MYFVPSSLKAPPPPSLPGQSSMSKPGEPPLATYRVQLPRRLRGLAESILKLVFSEHRSSGCFASSRAFLDIAPSRHPAPQVLGVSAAKVFSPPLARTGERC